MSKILTINVSAEYVFENHNVNASEDGRPKENVDRAIVSGQKIRYMLFEKMKDFLSKNGNQNKISTGDSLTGDIVNDLRSDFGGYMLTTSETEEEPEEGKKAKKVKKGKNEKRSSPLRVSFAQAKKKSSYFDDLFVRFKNDESKEDNAKQRINTKVFSQHDEFVFNYQLNVDELGRKKEFEIVDGSFVSEKNTLQYSEEEKLFRLELFLNSVSELKGLANQSRNAVENTPKKIFISFAKDRRFVNYFNYDETEKNNYLAEKVFIGDDKTNYTVKNALADAISWLKENKTALYL